MTHIRSSGLLSSGPRALGTALVVGVAVFAATVGTNLVTAQPAGNTNPSRVAVVNIEEILNGLDFLKIEQGKLKNKTDERQKELTTMANELDEMQKKLDLLPLEDKKRREQAATLVEKNATAQAKTTAYQQIINIEKGDLFKDAHNEVAKACKEYAEKNGFDLVIVDDRAIKFESNMSSDMVSAVIAQKRVLFAADAIDITKAILTKMNNDFAAGGKPAEKPKKK
ncbi:MAG: OmpH family outer membrane protein [Phycisphaerales bacterium]|nr:OmpH family outer membrane protein [Phycisphaerales bacterium]